MSDISEARASVRNTLGLAVEQKATDEFCLSYLRATAAHAEILESAPAVARIVGTAPAIRPVVLEFDRSIPSNAGVVGRAFAGAPAAANVAEILGGLVPDARRASARSLRSIPASSARDAFRRHVAAEMSELERVGAEDFLGGALGTTGRSRTVEVCWLNATLRAVTSKAALATVAESSRVLALDVPRRVTPEMLVTPTTVGAVAFRHTAHLTGNGIIVAVLDSEVQHDHPDLLGRVVQQRNYSSEAWGNPGAHGTVVAGIIAGAAQERQGIAPEATIYSYKVLTKQGRAGGDDFYTGLAIQHALEDGADIANCSWGAGPAGDGSDRVSVACNNAWNLGLLIVKSAGNDGPTAGSLTSPAAAEGIIVVGATDRRGLAVQSYSSRGPTSDGRQRPHVVAPGATRDDQLLGCLPGGAFGPSGAGTSYAAPHVAGLLALLLEQTPSATPDQLRDRLLESCNSLGAAPQEQGRGLIVIR